MSCLRILLFFLLLLFPLSSYSQLQSLEYINLAGFRVHKADLQQVTVVLNLRFYNPNRYGLTLKEGDVDAWFNHHYLGKAILDEKTRVPARDTFLIPVTLTAGLDKIFSNALELLTNNTVLIKLDGSVKAGKAGIFIRVPIRYEGSQRIEL